MHSFYVRDTTFIVRRLDAGKSLLYAYEIWYEDVTGL
jgi:hypothetical protein